MCPLLEAWSNLTVTGLVLWHSMTSDIIRSPLNFSFTSSPSNVWCETSRQICAPEGSYWCFPGGKWDLSGWPFWRYSPVGYPHQKNVLKLCQNIPSKHATGTENIRKKSNYEGKHCILKSIFLFFLLSVVLNVRALFPHGIKRYLDIWWRVGK